MRQRGAYMDLIDDGLKTTILAYAEQKAARLNHGLAALRVHNHKAIKACSAMNVE